MPKVIHCVIPPGEHFEITKVEKGRTVWWLPGRRDKVRELGSKREGACLQKGTGRNLVVIRVSTLTVCVFRDIQGMRLEKMWDPHYMMPPLSTGRQGT